MTAKVPIPLAAMKPRFEMRANTLCEWSARRNAPAIHGDPFACPNRATVLLAPAGPCWRVCDSCSRLQFFKHMRRGSGRWGGGRVDG